MKYSNVLFDIICVGFETFSRSSCEFIQSLSSRDMSGVATVLLNINVDFVNTIKIQRAQNSCAEIPSTLILLKFTLEVYS